MNQEWAGQTSQRFKGSRKIINPEYGAPTESPGLLGETNIGLERLKGRRHFESSECQTISSWRPCFKKTEAFVIPPKPSGIKRMDPEFSEVKPRAEKKHIIQSFPDEVSEYRIHMKTVLSETGKRIQDLPTDEYNFHQTQIGRKVRVEGLEQMRNGLDVKSLGDKSYKKPEHSSGFYREGGLITGSTVASRVPHQGKSAANNDFATVLSYEATHPMRIKWKDRERQMKEDEDSEAIRQLIEWEKTILKESNPKYVDPDISDGD
jgi:hypothetical protein